MDQGNCGFKKDGDIPASGFTPLSSVQTSKDSTYYVVENADDLYNRYSYDEVLYEMAEDTDRDICIDRDAEIDDEEELCEEEEKFECPENFFKAVERLKLRLVAVEFECAGCCKKAVGTLRCVKPDFIQLFRPQGGLVQIQMFCPGTCDITTECACEANIKFEKIISVEEVANQKCPPRRIPKPCK